MKNIINKINLILLLNLTSFNILNSKEINAIDEEKYQEANNHNVPDWVTLANSKIIERCIRYYIYVPDLAKLANGEIVIKNIDIGVRYYNDPNVPDWDKLKNAKIIERYKDSYHYTDLVTDLVYLQTIPNWIEIIKKIIVN